MHATRILPRCLADVFAAMHASRARCLLRAVEALVIRRQLVLTELARSWPGAERIHAPLKALDRLLSNRFLHQELDGLHGSMAKHVLLGRPHPLLLVDWSDLKGDGRWVLLRAGTPVGGRTLTVHERIFPAECVNSPAQEREFLNELEAIVPAGVVPILVTDAGFRGGWMQAVRALGWHFVGRVRNNTQVQLAGAMTWSGCTGLYAQAGRAVRDLGAARIVKGNPLPCRLVLAKRAPKGRKSTTRKGLHRRGTDDLRARKRADDPWLLATSLDPAAFNAARIVNLYDKRMQIESSFRDLKSEQYGVGFRNSQSRCRKRLAVLLMLHTLATFAAWLLSLAQQASPNLPDPMTRQTRHARRYSWLRRAIEWLKRANWPPDLHYQLRRVLRQAATGSLMP